MITRDVDVVVVGSGPAGLATATTLRRLGVMDVTVLEREEDPGGVPRHCHHPSFGLREFGLPMGGPRYVDALLRRAARRGVVIETSTTVLDIGTGPSPYVASTSPHGSTRWNAKAVVLATGCRERPRNARLIPGSRAPGVFTTGELQQFTYLHGVSVGRRAVVLGAEHVSFSAVMTLADAGTECVAVVTPHSRHQSYPPLQMWSTRAGRIPLLAEHEVVSIEGRGRVEGVVLRSPQGHTTVACDTVIVTGDWVAEGSLALAAGVSEDTRNGGRPTVNDQGATVREGIYATGGVVRPGESATSAVRAGFVVASTVANDLSLESGHRPGIPVKWNGPIRWLSPGLLNPGEPTKLRVRVDQLMEAPTVVFRSDGDVVDTVRLRLMMPGRTYTLDGSWAKRLGDGARDVQVSAGTDQ